MPTGRVQSIMESHHGPWWSQNKAYCHYKDDQGNMLYTKWNMEKDQIDGDPWSPGTVSGGYGTSFPASFKSIDACLIAPDVAGIKHYMRKMAYLFCGDSYIKFDVEKQCLHTTSPSKIKSGFPGYPFDGVDACLVFPHKSNGDSNGPGYTMRTAYMFYKDKYCKWCLERDILEAHPRSIKDGFPGFPDRVDAFMTFPGGGEFPHYARNIAYVFYWDYPRAEQRYIKWNLSTDTHYSNGNSVKAGFPYLATVRGGIGGSDTKVESGCISQINGTCYAAAVAHAMSCYRGWSGGELRRVYGEIVHKFGQEGDSPYNVMAAFCPKHNFEYERSNFSGMTSDLEDNLAVGVVVTGKFSFLKEKKTGAHCLFVYSKNGSTFKVKNSWGLIHNGSAYVDVPYDTLRREVTHVAILWPP